MVVDTLDTRALRRLRAALEVMIEELGSQATLRQALALVVIALHNKAGSDVGVAILDRELGNLSPGSASKVIKQMLHVSTPRKGDLANMLLARRDPVDLRKWNLEITEKGIGALATVIKAMEGTR